MKYNENLFYMIIKYDAEDIFIFACASITTIVSLYSAGKNIRKSIK